MADSAIFGLIRPAGKRRPILVSAPHVGTEIPASLGVHFDPKSTAALEDTDWHVHELYRFCIDLGITLIHAHFSRYIVDLNRPIDGHQLYQDQRQQTQVVPLTNFAGQALYRPGKEPEKIQREQRIQTYYRPYHDAIAGELKLLAQGGREVVLFDAHSIRRHVPSITAEPFPDLIIGDRDGTSAGPHVTAALRNSLGKSPYEVSYNHPFKGGQITRFFGQPASGVHAVQLEMSQDLYLSEGSHELDALKVGRLQPVLADALLALVRAVETP